MSLKSKIIPEGDGFYTIADVPIFETHDSRGFACNEGWMKEAIKNFEVQKASGYRPPIIIGHNVKGGNEKEAQGFIDNLRLVGKRLVADLTRLPKDLKDKIKRNAYPSRSVEVLPKSKRILALALLGGTPPYFSLPQIVYNRGNSSNEETAIWYRSPIMHSQNIDAITQAAADAAARAATEAVANYSADDNEPEVYDLTVEEATQFLSENPDAEIYEAEDGTYFTYAAEGDVVTVPASLIKRLWGGVKGDVGGAGRAAKSIASHAFEGTKTVGRNIRHPQFKPRYAKIRNRVKHPLLSASSAAQKIGHGAVRAARGTAHTGMEALRATGRVGRHPLEAAISHPLYTAAGLGAAGAGALAARNRMRRNDARYEIDENSGVIYFDGQPLGEISVYDVNDLPQPENASGDDNPDLIVESGDVGPGSGTNTALSNDPGEPDNEFVQPMDRDDSDQFSDPAVSDALNYIVEDSNEQGAQLYNLQNEVSRLKYANDLLQVSKRAEQYKSYLLNMKKAGAPISNVDSTVDFMLSQTDEQVKQFKQILESSPKVAMGPVQFEADTDRITNDAKVEYSAHANEYAALGVTEKDIKYANFVRTSGFSNSKTNDNSIFD